MPPRLFLLGCRRGRLLRRVQSAMSETANQMIPIPIIHGPHAAGGLADVPSGCGRIVARVGIPKIDASYSVGNGRDGHRSGDDARPRRYGCRGAFKDVCGSPLGIVGYDEEADGLAHTGSSVCHARDGRAVAASMILAKRCASRQSLASRPCFRAAKLHAMLSAVVRRARMPECKRLVFLTPKPWRRRSERRHEIACRTRMTAAGSPWRLQTDPTPTHMPGVSRSPYMST